ncbi:hypothetical protein [Chroococcus sp. FPU101]|uniref:hypothetical protein n=1 Tax=Chroococcus sp. FPU101 TaxID=1974212 RepID=UPI001A8FB1DB|nr:hypothetical protein [Chroococcus sp. FPU101]GFE72157.1 hypothetical protein CFPU101_47670 [Chroococcus sp. FPU101]
MKTKDYQDTAKGEERLTSKIEEGHPLFSPSRFKYVPLVVISLLLLNLLATCQSNRASHRALMNRPYIYVQQTDGTAIKVSPADSLYRSDETLIDFASNWLKLAYTWKLKNEPGKEANERGRNFPYPFHLASLAIALGYREAYMDLIANTYQKEFPLSRYITGEEQCYVRIFETPQIEKIKPGLWNVTIVATRTHARGNSIFAHEVFNHVIQLRAVEPTTDESKLWGNRDTELGKQLAAMQYQGLQIVEIGKF